MEVKTSNLFPVDYAQGRRSFTFAAQETGCTLTSWVLPGYRGTQGEELALDSAFIQADTHKGNASPLVIISSGVHGVEGLCGSGCQQALLQDEDLLGKAQAAGVDLLFLHAINPYGFSYLRRGNEDNVDLNRNCIDFSKPPSPNPDYEALDALLIPAQWPPEKENELALAKTEQTMGTPAFRRAVTSGQASHPYGLFFSGQAPCWSNQTVRQILQQYGSGRKRIAWVDIHTGLGPRGHGEKIHAGRPTREDILLSRKLWGADVVAAWEGQSASAQVKGPVVSCVYEECPAAEVAAIALEFGTVPYHDFMMALRADQWLHRQAAPKDAQASAIKQAMRSAFYVDADDWRGMVAAQTRVAVLQACWGIGNL
jgi:hypothetical protein